MKGAAVLESESSRSLQNTRAPLFNIVPCYEVPCYLLNNRPENVTSLRTGIFLRPQCDFSVDFIKLPNSRTCVCGFHKATNRNSS